MRGMLMTTDAIIASFIILLMVVFWVQMQSRLVDSEVREADAEGKTARLLALSEWILAQGKETGIERAAGREGTDAASGFGVKGASIGFWRVGEERGAPGRSRTPLDQWCVRFSGLALSSMRR